MVDGDQVRAYAGTGMALRLGRLLGPRKAWRVWNLALRYGVGWPAGEEFSPERRGFLKRAALFVGSLFFFPRFGSAGGRGQARGRPRHPFEGIRIKDSRELEEGEKAQAVQQALESPDMQNVRGETRAAPDAAKAIVVGHELEGGNTLLAVGFPTDQGVLSYYQFTQPVDHYATLAWMYVVEGEETARLVSASVNGRSVSRSGSANMALQQDCGDCTGIPWNFLCSLCYGVDIGCALECCGLCGFCGWNPACILDCLLRNEN